MANVQNLDLNFATAEELTAAGITGLDDDLAKELVVFRDENGPFESWDNVMEVPGYNADLTKRMQEAGITISSLSTTSRWTSSY
jgi:DNA uptake protein ComE-like DNA-binding protein